MKFERNIYIFEENTKIFNHISRILTGVVLILPPFEVPMKVQFRT
jgi:hypothetical protein